MSVRPIKIAVMALGGQGGGVLADWIVKAGERSGFIAQTTSVPGVAQRTGATIYYVELFPKLEAESNHAAPILALMPAPSDVDIVIAAEMMEAGRALARGFVSKETTLIASTHRTYAIGEKVALGDGRQDAEIVRKDVDDKAGRAIWFDMEKAAEESGAVISAVLLGALSGSGAAPVSREIFEEEIRKSGRAVEKNIVAFSLGFERAKAGAPLESGEPHRDRHESAAAAVAPLVQRLSEVPESVRKFAKPGLKRVVDFQDARYGALYLDRLLAVLDVDRKNGGEANDFTLTVNVAKYLALAMAYDDVIRVADMKTRAERFDAIRNEVRAGDAQIVRVVEFMHPRVEEAADLAPPAIARWMLNSSSARRLFGAMLGKGGASRQPIFRDSFC
ncbi:MAG: indolepyruvate oxidoreductase subunit beta family protein [Parvularculaceae bacterium]